MGADLQNKIKTLMTVRRNQMITSTSTISVQMADATRYAAIVNGNTAMKTGPGSWSPSGAGWTLAASGNDRAVWTK